MSHRHSSIFPFIKKALLGFCFLGFASLLKSQSVFEYHHSEVYHYLYRMAQKGIIRFDDNIRPISRMYIEQCLDSVSSNHKKLSAIESKELLFYKQEFNDQLVMAQNNPTPKAAFFKKEKSGRWRGLSISGNQFLLRADPIITYATIQGSKKNLIQKSGGFNFYGYDNKHWAFYFSFNDIQETGTGLDTLKKFSSETGMTNTISNDKKSQYFGNLRGGISYSWKNGSFSFGQDYLLNGYGENGRMILSDKAPSYPYIRLDYQPISWLKFNYTHAWLNSNIIDSNRTYSTGVPTYGGIRQQYISKFIASHSLQFTPTKGIDITIGESMVYSDKLNVGYLIPILFFKAYDNLTNNNNINTGSNGQLFLQASSRNNIPNTHLYGTLFVDEIRVGTLFDKSKSRNQLGFSIGGSVTDVLLPYLSFGIEYTRINPFVYRNITPAQNYTSENYLLGDWMGNNADRLIYTIKYTPLPKLKFMIRYQSIRKGGQGTLDQQYFAEPQPAFLFDLQKSQKEWHTLVSYEWINKLYLNSYFTSIQTNDFITGKKNTQNIFSLGMSFGL